MTKRFMRSFFGRRILPPLLLLGLIGAAYWLYSKHQTTAHDPRDFALATFCACVFFVVPLYLMLRTDPWPVQSLGYVGLMWGDLVFYGSFVANYLGWTTFSIEQRLDALRACATIGATLLVLGLIFFEWVRWHDRRTGQTTDSAHDPVLYDRRRQTDRRKGWGKLPE